MIKSLAFTVRHFAEKTVSQGKAGMVSNLLGCGLGTRCPFLPARNGILDSRPAGSPPKSGKTKPSGTARHSQTTPKEIGRANPGASAISSPGKLIACFYTKCRTVKTANGTISFLFLTYGTP